MSASQPLDSETYRQMLVRDGERRRQEWQAATAQHHQHYQRALAQTRPRYVPSEEYRQRLVRDGDRRFQDWHQSFLAYQKKFLSQSKG